MRVRRVGVGTTTQEDHTMTRLELYLAAYRERFGRLPRHTPEYHDDDQESTP